MNAFGIGLAEIGAGSRLAGRPKEIIFQHCCTKCNYEFKAFVTLSTCLMCGADTSSNVIMNRDTRPLDEALTVDG